MKIKVLSRNPDDYLRETKRDIQKVPRNYDPALHPFEAPREYIRALNATKLERVFAKPFLGALDGHRDGVRSLCKHPTALSLLLSGACDGEVKVWSLAKRSCLQTIQAHEGMVQGLCMHQSGRYFFSVGNDKTIKQWSLSDCGQIEEEPQSTILGKTIFTSIDHHWSENKYATCGQQLDIWDEDRTEPVRSFTWGVDSLHAVKFNPIETNIVGSCASDRSIILYDMRGAAPLRKVILKLRSNTIAWNPMEAFIFTVANEDYNLYSFDMRKLSMPVTVHMDHVSAGCDIKGLNDSMQISVIYSAILLGRTDSNILQKEAELYMYPFIYLTHNLIFKVVMDVDYSPTGREFASAGYDKVVRIFPADRTHSREIYHTKRMQRVETVRWSLDNKYILSGSDEMNIRIWKAQASEKLGVLKPREKTAFNYNSKLKEKFAFHPEVKRISRHRHVPKMIYNQQKEMRIIRQSQKRKEANRRKHSKPGAVPFVPERKKSIIKEVE